MITKQELQRIAGARKLKDIAFMEKDYALTWALKAIYTNSTLSNVLIFKGGTCLSKIYAENYRLSEDLDFSIKGVTLGDAGFKEWFTKAFETIKAEGGPELKVTDMHSNPGYTQFKIQYKAVLEQAGTIKLDISNNEFVIHASNSLPLKEKLYSDVGEFKVNCYSLQEIMVEKMRALFQRGKTRDYYDIWRILKEPVLKKQLMLDIGDLRKLLKEKCDKSKVPYEPELMFSSPQVEETGKHWKDSLERLVVDLPEFSTVIIDLQKIFFEETELAIFVGSLGIEHLDDVNRGSNTEPLIERAVDILIEKLNSRRKKEVMKILGILVSIYSKKEYAPALTIEKRKAIVKLQNDKDQDIKHTVASLVALITRKGIRKN